MACLISVVIVHNRGSNRLFDRGGKSDATGIGAARRSGTVGARRNCGGWADAASADFEPGKFEDRYETALTELINEKRNGRTVAARPCPRGDNVVNLMDALKRSPAGGQKSELPKAAKSKRRNLPVKKKCCCRSPDRGLGEKPSKETEPSHHAT